MTALGILSSAGLTSQNRDRFSVIPPSVMAAASRTKHAGVVHRALVKISAFTIVALLDVTCILWVYPLANQIAEWAGASHLKAVHIGLGVLLASIPVIIALTLLAWRMKGEKLENWYRSTGVRQNAMK